MSSDSSLMVPPQPSHGGNKDFGVWISVRSAVTTQIKAPAVSSAPTEAAPREQTQQRLCSSCWQPGRPTLMGSVTPAALPPRGWCQANEDTAQGSTSRASFPLREAHCSSDLRGSGLISVAGGTSGLHINYLMNVALFSVH